MTRNFAIIRRITALLAISQAALLGQQCTPTHSTTGQETGCANPCELGPSYTPSSCPLCKWVSYRAQFPDGFVDYRTLIATGKYNRMYEECNGGTSTPYTPTIIQCWPDFFTPVTYDDFFRAEAYDKSTQITTLLCGVAPFNYLVLCTLGELRAVTISHSCTPTTCPDTRCYPIDPKAYKAPDPCMVPDPPHCEPGWQYDEATLCCLSGGSPIIIDVDGDGFHLTAPSDGVMFDLRGGGRSERWSWTAAGADDVWLSLDRNGNGLIDDGTELFGDATVQPKTPGGRNGFKALAVFDQTNEGGNNDETIDARDSVFASLRLWRDANHNGISENGELLTLQELGITAISLKYKESKWTDAYGNQFKYRAIIERSTRGKGRDKWAYDVFLVADSTAQ